MTSNTISEEMFLTHLREQYAINLLYASYVITQTRRLKKCEIVNEIELLSQLFYEAFNLKELITLSKKEILTKTGKLFIFQEKLFACLIKLIPQVKNGRKYCS
jgi:uncharacterized Rmd1/YagE family protein